MCLDFAKLIIEIKFRPTGVFTQHTNNIKLYTYVYIFWLTINDLHFVYWRLDLMTQVGCEFCLSLLNKSLLSICHPYWQVVIFAEPQ